MTVDLLPFALIAIGLVVVLVTLREDRDMAAVGVASGGLALACTGLAGTITLSEWNPGEAIGTATGVVGALAWVAALGAGLGGMMRGDRRQGGSALTLAGLTAVAAVVLAAQ